MLRLLHKAAIPRYRILIFRLTGLNVSGLVDNERGVPPSGSEAYRFQMRQAGITLTRIIQCDKVF